MTAKDLSVIVRGVAPIIREYVASAVGALVDRLSALETRMAAVKDGRDGRDGEAALHGPVSLRPGVDRTRAPA